jgi:hypothetical protein
MSLQSLLRRQAGVVSREQAMRAGLSQDALDRLLRLRRWRPLHRGVYLADGHRLDDEARVRAAVLWAGCGAVLSGAAAAWWHGLVGAPATITLRTPRPLRPPPGVAVHQHRLDPADVTERRGLVVTSPALSVLEAAVELGARGDALLDRALRLGVGLPAVRAAHLRTLDAPGAARAARMLRAAAGRSAVAVGESVIFATPTRRLADRDQVGRAAAAGCTS